MKRPKARAPARSIKSARGRTARKTAAAVGLAVAAAMERREAKRYTEKDPEFWGILNDVTAKSAIETLVVAGSLKAPNADPNMAVRVMGTDSGIRKMYPVASGLLDYFPDACLEVANVSYAGNEKHNPGEPMHHARGKSMDHADCIGRHLVERGGYDEFVIKGLTFRIRHTAALAWRAMALLQEELEQAGLVSLPRAAVLP